MTTQLVDDATGRRSTPRLDRADAGGLRSLVRCSSRWLVACIALAAAACGGTEATSRGSAASLERDGGDTARTTANACAAGFPRGDSGAACQVVFGGACFATTDAACACAGCASAKCLVLESFPEQIACQR